MAPIFPDDAHMLKRSSSAAGLDLPQSKKQLRHHGLRWRQELPGPLDAPFQDDEAVQALLTRSIGLALEAVGFESADPVAVESFRALAEEYMVNFLASVRQSMLSSRRIQAIPQDYLQALHEHHLTLSALILHLDPPVLQKKSQPPLTADTAEIDGQSVFFPTFKPILDDKQAGQSNAYIPTHFPTLPGSHTYKATEESTKRETDPRRIRERATEEGRLGEEALRRLVGTGSQLGDSDGIATKRKAEVLRKRRNELWRKTMDAVARGTGPMPGFARDISGDAMETLSNSPFALPERQRLTSAVNAEKSYWRKESRS